MHVTGDVERAISCLGSKNIMQYAMALKTIKEQFGLSSLIARAVINNLTKGEKFGRSDRRGLREFSIDLINCIATADQMIERWRGVVADIRKTGQVPTVSYISEIVRKKVKAEYDPDFGDLYMQRNSRNSRKEQSKGGIHASNRDSHKVPLKCYVCEEDHRVIECPAMAKASVPGRLELAKKARLCFSCLNRGHLKNDCRSRKRCEKSESCPFFHHPLLHSNPPSSPPVGNVTPVNPARPGVASVLDKNTVMPVVRARFRAPNGRVREGNILIDSDAGTTVLRKQFAKELELNGKRERIDLAAVGGERLEQPHSRRVNFWISGINRGQEFKIETHEIEKTILSVPD